MNVALLPEANAWQVYALGLCPREAASCSTLTASLDL